MESVQACEFDRVAMQTTTPKVRSLLQALDPQTLSAAEGCRFSVNDSGRLVYAEYQTGAAVRRHPLYVVARNAQGSYWFVNQKGHCLPLD